MSAIIAQKMQKLLRMCMEEITMTLQQLIDQATSIGRKITTCEIPVIYNGVNDNLHSLSLSQDNYGNYYVNLQ